MVIYSEHDDDNNWEANYKEEQMCIEEGANFAVIRAEEVMRMECTEMGTTISGEVEYFGGITHPIQITIEFLSDFAFTDEHGNINNYLSITLPKHSCSFPLCLFFFMKNKRS